MLKSERKSYFIVDKCNMYSNSKVEKKFLLYKVIYE